MKTIPLSNGKSVTVQALGPLLMQKINDGLPPLPKPPTYEADTAGGGKETIVHNETTLQTEEEKAAWAKYQAALANWKAEQSERFLRVFFARGVQIDLDDTALNRWAREVKYLGVSVPEINPDDPDDPEVLIERRILYVQTEIVGSKEDIFTIMKEVMKLTGIDEGAVAEATRLFRGEVEGSSDNSGNAG